jgi:hypothetical protein
MTGKEQEVTGPNGWNVIGNRPRWRWEYKAQSLQPLLRVEALLS